MGADGKQGDGDWRSARDIIGDGRLSVIMPAYSLAGRIAGNVVAVADTLAGRIPYEIVAVDDGSPDATGDELRALAASRPDIPLVPVVLPVNGGKGNALREGFRASRGDFVLLLDGDLDLLPARIPEFFDAMAENRADVVIGSKRHSRSVVRYPWHRRLASLVYYSVVRLLVGLPVTDTQVGMKLFRRRTLGDSLARMLVKTYAFDIELLAIAFGRGARVCEAPVTLKYGAVFGALKPRAVVDVLRDTLAVFYRLRVLKYYAKVEVPPPMDRMPLVSVVVACPGPGAMLEQCLSRLARQTYGAVEAIVLPDAPFEAPPRADGLAVAVIPTGKVRPAEKRNLGIRAAKGEIVAFIDDDAYPDAHWLECAVKYFTIPDVGAVGGPGVTPPDDPYLAQLGGRVYASRLVSGNYRYRYVAGRTREDIDDYPSCNLLVRTSLLREFGGYRTDFWPGEDTLLCKDVVDRGRRIVYDPWAIVYHHRRPLFGAHLRQLGRYAFHRGYFCKRFPSNSLHLSYFIPSAFVAYLLAIPVAAAALVFAPEGGWKPYAALALAAPLALYFVLVAAASFSFNPVSWILVAAGVVATHLCYGVRFLAGLCAKKAPCEFIGADHGE